MKKSPPFFLLLFVWVFGAAIAASAQTNYEPYTFTTFVGVASSADGLGSAARFNGPDGTAVDSAGNIYVADVSNHTIRKITPDGYVATFVGSAGDYGSADGVGSSARFAWPEGVTVGGMGNLYVCGESHTIRKVTPAGVVSTLAGSGSHGSADGTGTAAQFFNPYALAADNAENVYVADTYNSTIRKIDPSGLVTTLAGSAGIIGSADGPGNVARFNYPYGITVDGSGNVYVADSSNSTIRKINPAGVVSTFAGLPGSPGSADGVGTTARFRGPVGLAADGSGNLYVADSSNYTIRKITPAGVVSTLAGLAGTSGTVDGTGSAARFGRARGITVDGTGNLYVVDGNTIRKITPDRVVTTIAGYTGLGLAGPDGTGTDDGTGSAARLDIPTGVAVDSERNLYVHDGRGNGLRKVTPAAVVSTLANIEGAYFSRSYNVALDNAGNVVVGAYGGIQKVGPCGAVSTIPGGQGLRVSGLTMDDTGNVYVTINQTIQKITPSGVVSTFAGLAGSSGSADGTGSAARFSGPTGVALDSSGNFYVADSGNNTIRKITPAGAVTTLAGLAGNSGSTDGAGNVARFSGPGGVAVDGSGNVYVTDFGNNTIRKITPVGVVTTLAGAPGNHDFDSVDGTGSVARFYEPLGIAVDNTGNVYVVEWWNSLIRVGRPPNPHANLSDLTLSVAPLDPAFSPTTTSYIISVPNSSTSTNVIATVPDADSTVTINGNPASSGVPFGPIALDPGNNFITVVVNSAGETKPYTIQINRALLVSNLSDNGVGSLRQALCDADDFGNITIDIPPVGNAPAVPAVLTLTTGELVVNKHITISGPGANLLTINRDPSAGPFRIFHITPRHRVTIEGLTISGGDIGADSGAGIFNDGSFLTVIGCAFPQNSVEYFGGAIDTNGTDAASSSLTIDRCTFSENSAERGGSAVYSVGVDLTINNSTFSSNVSRYGRGADIELDGQYNTLKLTNSTFSGPASPYGRIGNIGGIITVGNTILQTGPGGLTFASPSSSVVSLGYNLASDNAGGSLTATGDQVNTDAMLGPLKDNGGPTLTHAPLVNSPAIDRGKRNTIPALTTDIDQRGSARPVDDPAVANAAGGDASDVGAVELGIGVHPIAAASLKSHGDAGSFPIDLPLTGTPGTECRSGGPNGDYQLIVTFSQPITFSSAAVTSGIGQVSGASLISNSYSRQPNRAQGTSGTQVAINLTGVTNVQVITVALFDVADGTHSGDVGIRMGVLVGDTTNSRKVNVTDISQTKSQSGQVVTADNFRTDVTADGSINTSDISLVKSKSGTALH